MKTRTGLWEVVDQTTVTKTNWRCRGTEPMTDTRRGLQKGTSTGVMTIVSLEEGIRTYIDAKTTGAGWTKTMTGTEEKYWFGP